MSERIQRFLLRANRCNQQNRRRPYTELIGATRDLSARLADKFSTMGTVPGSRTHRVSIVIPTVSCHQKRTLLTSIHVAEDVCFPVAHRQVVFTIPKRLRVHARFDRKLLGKLSSCAWACIKAEIRRMLGREDVVPGMIAAIQTHGTLLHGLKSNFLSAPERAPTLELAYVNHLVIMNYI